MMQASTPYHCTSPQEVRKDNRRSSLRSIWQSAEWKRESAAYRARHFPVCSRCGRVCRIVPGHSGEDYSPYELKRYIDKVRRDQVVPLCHKCNRMEARGRHPCPGCIAKHREEPDHYIRYIGQDRELCFVCEHGADGIVPLRRKQRHFNRHSCGWHGAGVRCGNPLRHDHVCPYSARTAPQKCDADHFTAR